MQENYAIWNPSRTAQNDLDNTGGERFRGKPEKRFEKSMVAAGNGPSIANQRLLQYVT